MIKNDTTIKDVLDNHPKGEEILSKYNFPCLSCPMAKYEIETLEIGDVCNTYGLDLEGLLKDLNE